MSGNRLTPRRVKLCRALAWGLYKSVLLILFLLSANGAFGMASLFSRRPKMSDASTQVSFDDDDAREELQRKIIEEERQKTEEELRKRGGNLSDEFVLMVNPSEHYPLAPELTEEEKRNYVCQGYSWQEMMDAYSMASDKVKRIVEHLREPLNPVLRSAFFVGPQGTGKTSTAYAIPHVAHWFFYPINAGELLSTHRNETKKRLARCLQKALTSHKKVIVIIDEINRLLENFKSKKHDSDATASYLWTFLDSQRHNYNFFLIGTMNEDHKLPEQIKNRKGGTTIYFEELSSDRHLEIFKKKVIDERLEFAAECTDAFLDSFIRIMKKDIINFSPRDYENLRFELDLAFLDGKPGEQKVCLIKIQNLLDALKSIVATYNHSRYGHEELSEEEWRDFNAVQQRIIDIKLQSAQKIPMGMSAHVNPLHLLNPVTALPNMVSDFCGSLNANVSRSPGLNVREAAKIIVGEFSPHQISVYEMVMKRSIQESFE